MNESTVKLMLFVLGTLLLFFGICTLIGLFQLMLGRKPTGTPSKRWLLGVCADFSHLIGIPLWLVRTYAVVFTPMLVGIIFYFLYFLVMLSLRKPAVKAQPDNPRNVNVTRMDTYHFRK